MENLNQKANTRYWAAW